MCNASGTLFLGVDEHQRGNTQASAAGREAPAPSKQASDSKQTGTAACKAVPFKFLIVADPVRRRVAASVAAEAGRHDAEPG
jgi:hypothetical protein